MARKRHTEEEIIAVLKDAQARVSVLVYSTREVPEQRWATGRGGDGGRGLVKGNLHSHTGLSDKVPGTGRPRALEWVRRAVGRGDRTMSYIAMLLHHIIYHLDTHRAAYLSRLVCTSP